MDNFDDLTLEEKRLILIDELARETDEKRIRALTEALKAIENIDAGAKKQQELDLRELELRSAEDRAEKEEKNANKRSKRQLVGDIFRTAGTLAASAIGVLGSLFYLKTSIEAERNPDDPVILKNWERNRPKLF